MKLRTERINWNWTRWTFAIVAIVIILVPTYADGATYQPFNQDVDFAAIAGDGVQNNLDPGARTNYDTWDPAPNGVWFGGWAIESLLRLRVVPDDEFQVAMAQVCYFTGDLIMSGAARTLVRLPMRLVDGGSWDRARLNVYAIDQSTNWTWDYFDTPVGPPGMGLQLDHMKINFTEGPHELIFWSENYDPTDTSPTDDNDHFSRANRTFAFVDAPLPPNQYLLFVTYAWYPSDYYVEIYWSPDSLDADGDWNRSSLSTYNRVAPDAYSIESYNSNASFGYSFDFTNGYGNSAYGFNSWMNAGDELKFFSYVNLTHVNDDDYLTLMVPFRAATDNVSWNISIYIFNPISGGFTEIFTWGNYITREFLLISMEDDWDNNSTGLGFTPNGWFLILMQINNDTRIRMPLWDITPETDINGPNQTWNGTSFGGVWDTDYYLNYNPMHWIQLNRGGTDFYKYHWMPQHTLQFANYVWTKNVPATSGETEHHITDDMSFGDKILYGIGFCLLIVGEEMTGTLGFRTGEPLRWIGAAFQLIAFAGVTEGFGFSGWAWDGLKRIGQFFMDIGTWIWRGVQAVIGAISWLVDTIVYYSSIILGILIFALSIFTGFFMLYFSAKIAMTIVSAFRFRGREAVGHIKDMAATTSKMRGG